jgi:hypothetical protein
MGCDIHSVAEKRERNTWVDLGLVPQPFDWRSYSLFGFLAGVRNYSAIPSIAEFRGFPADASDVTKSDYKKWDMDAHSPSWLLMSELLEFDYDAPMIDRRVTRQTGPNSWSGGVTGTIEEGEKTTFRAFLGEGYFRELDRLKAAGCGRVVFWFDN